MFSNNKNKYIAIVIGLIVFIGIVVTINYNLGLRENLAQAVIARQTVSDKITADKAIADKKVASDKALADSKIASDKAIADAKIIADKKIADDKIMADAQAVIDANKVADAKAASEAQARSNAYAQWVRDQFTAGDLSCPSLIRLVTNGLYSPTTFQVISTRHTDNGNQTLTVWMSYWAMDLGGQYMQYNVTAIDTYATRWIQIVP